MIKTPLSSRLSNEREEIMVQNGTLGVAIERHDLVRKFKVSDEKEKW